MPYGFQSRFLRVNRLHFKAFRIPVAVLIFVAVIPLSVAAEKITPQDSRPTAKQLVQGAIDHWRSKSSWGKITMRIHRRDWQREMTLESWTRGEKDSLIRFIAPAKDAGNATLKLDNAMWMFTPKLNQVIKLPASMMAQSWMGSDFSYNDLAKSDRLLSDYHLTLTSHEERQGHTYFSIEATPKEGAPVVWGKELLVVRDDYILMDEQFFDQDGALVKRMRTTKIATIAGRLYPVIMRMERVDEAQRWTEIETEQAQFDISLPDYLFTQSNLRNPRNWSADQ